MNSWSFHNPVQVRFGVDSIDEIGALLHGRSFAIVTYPDAPFRAMTRRIEQAAGPAIALIDTVEANPSLPMLRDACDRLAALPQPPDVLVALGGGSAMDAAKVLAAERGDFEAMLAYLEGGPASGCPALPIIAVPTTSGTGSEATCWATVWDPEKQRKLSLTRGDLYPEAVLVDPRLVLGLPREQTIASGLDALSHALESIWNVNSSPITRDLAVGAAREIMAALPRVATHLTDLEARGRMARGALRAGLAFSNTRTALAHNISYALTLRHGIAHGVACSFCLPAVMQAALGVDAECDAALARIFGDAADGPRQISRLLEELGVATHPSAYGIDAREWQHLIDDAFQGARGINFIGSRERFPAFDFASFV